MKAITALLSTIGALLLTDAADGDTIKGQANYPHLNTTWTVEFILVYDPDSGKGTLSWRHAPNSEKENAPKLKGEFYEAPFVMTQRPSVANSLFGYAVHRHTPLTIRIDLWDKAKPFFFYDPWWADSVVIKGQVE